MIIQVKQWIRDWLPLILSAVATAMSVAALLISIRGNDIALQARNDARAISGLNLRPNLSITAYFRKIKDTPPHFTVVNRGPLQVLQLEIQPIAHRYLANEKKFALAQWGSEELQVVDKLEPLRSISFAFSDHWLNLEARMQEPSEHNVMEIRLTYRCPPDMRQFVEGAFYFLSPEGRWVGENDASLTPEVYEPLKQAVLEFAAEITTDTTYASDILHPIKVEE